MIGKFALGKENNKARHKQIVVLTGRVRLVADIAAGTVVMKIFRAVQTS